MTKSIYDIPFQLIDVGASGGFQSKWQKFKNIKCFGFEPDSRDKSASVSKENQTWFNIGVYGVPGEYKFNLLKAQCNSSILEPNLNLIRDLAYDLEDFSTIKQVNVHCDNLDHICQEHKMSPDVIKLDTQGTEHEILTHSQLVLNDHLFFLEVEVEFLPLYKDQKLFSDVDSLLRKNGFDLVDIGNQLYVKGKPSSHFNLRKGYLISADAIYVRRKEEILRRIDQTSPAKLLAMLPICAAYGYLNLAFDIFTSVKEVAPQKYKELCVEHGDLLELIRSHLPDKKWWTISERKFAKVKYFFEKRIRPHGANWNYGIGNPR